MQAIIIEENPGTPYKRLEKDTSERGNDNINDEAESIELVFKEKKVIPPWKNQLTIRSIVVSILLGILFTMLSMKQSLSIGWINPLGMYAAIVGLSSVKTLTMVLEMCGVASQPFSRQENTIIQTCILAICGVTSFGGFRNYLFAMSSITAKELSPLDDDKHNIKNPGVGWMIIFLLLASFAGLLIIIPLRKIMIIDLKLVFPSGYAIGHQINTIQVPLATKFAKKQVVTFGKFFSLSFFWSCLQWLISGGKACGLSSLPIFGTTALEKGFYFDFHGMYVGIGMMCPLITSVSLLIGAILCEVVVSPYIQGKSGDWYSASLSPDSYRGPNAYEIFMAVSLMFGDSVYCMLKFVIVALFHKLRNKDSLLPVVNENQHLSDEHMRTQHFINEQFPSPKIAIGGYVVLAIISAVGFPLIFPPLKWTHVLAMYALGPVFSFCRVHVTGHTDMTPSYNFGKLLMFVFGSWVGNAPGGVLINLVVCGFIIISSSTSADLMTDLKTSYLTMSSSKSLFISRLIGTTIGCIINPLTFLYFITHYKDFGTPGSTFGAPDGVFYREIAVEGLQGLPKNCLLLCLAAFIIAFVINLIRDILPKKLAKFVPIPIAIAVPFMIGYNISVSMCIGSLIAFLWRWKNKAEADAFIPMVASAVFCGDGLTTLLQSILALLNWKAPWCLNFVRNQV